MFSNILYIYEEELIADGMSKLIKEINPDVKITKKLLYDDLESIISNNDFDLIFISKCKNFDISYISPIINVYNANCKLILVSKNFSVDDVKKFYQYNINGLINTKYSTEKIKYILNLIMLGENYYPSEVLPYGNKLSLSNQQMKIVEILRKGYSNKQIAYELNISESTVKVHMTAIMRKLNCVNRIQVIRKLFDLGILQYD